jgi:N-acetylglucosaminyl-diphospho-decaprenol L-rhamnosyltransferase
MVSAVIVCTNERELLRKCLTSIFEAPPRLPLEVIVVDNASTDGSAEMVRETFSSCRVITNQKRLGFASNNNIGMRETRGHYVFLINSDAWVRPGAIDTLVGYMDEHPRVGICGPRVLNPDGSLQLSCRRFPRVRSVLMRRIPLFRWLLPEHILAEHLMEDWDHASSRPVDWLLSACLLVRREAIDAVGLMDDAYFLYAEDVDWCWRMWRNEWHVHYVPEAEAFHHYRRLSARHMVSKKTLIHIRSLLHFWRKNHVPLSKVL